MAFHLVRIGDALTEAAERLKGRLFRSDEIELVDRAFARFGKTRPSDDECECAAALLAHFDEEEREKRAQGDT
jgi:hypothetical protein